MDDAKKTSIKLKQPDSPETELEVYAFLLLSRDDGGIRVHTNLRPEELPLYSMLVTEHARASLGIRPQKDKPAAPQIQVVPGGFPTRLPPKFGN